MTTSQAEPFRVALLSDLHAYSPSNPAAKPVPSFLATSPVGTASSSPTLSALKLITDLKLKCDLLLCGGDLGDKADPDAQAFVWAKLWELKSALNAQQLIVAPGNHDLDSRYTYNDHDAKGTLQALGPTFPGLSLEMCDRFWSRNYVILSGSNWRMVLLNSAAYHGGGKDASQEAQHGRVSKSTIEAIVSELKPLDPLPLNILFTHHHLLKNDEITTDDYSHMSGGDQLLNKLCSGNLGDWIVIHGHKHYPRIWRAPGTASAPIIFSAASFAAFPWPGQATRNQFYMLEFPIDEIARLKAGVVGRVTAWDWAQGEGWIPAKADSVIPHKAGFGSRTHPKSLADSIAAQLGSSAEPWLEWAELCQGIPELSYLAPSDMEHVLATLRSAHGIKVAYNDHRLPEQLRKL